MSREEEKLKIRARIGIALSVVLTLAFFAGSVSLIMRHASAVPAWPSSWIMIDWDRAEDGTGDDWRDVEYAFYQFDIDYLYLNLQCYSLPGSEWATSHARYKWFIDTDGNMYYSGGNVFDAEYLLFVEDTNHDGAGEMYLISDSNGDNSFNEYEPWPPANYESYKITDLNIGGWTIVAPNQIEMYVKWTSIETPPSYGLFWATDQENPNLDQGPTTDRVDEEQVIIVHNVAAVDQTPTPQIVTHCHGEHVIVEVVIANTGTQIETFTVTCFFNSTAIGTQLVSNLAAGHQTTLLFDWNTSGLPVGNYTITAWADSSAAIAELDEEDNWCTAPAVVSIVPELVRDVAAVSQVPDKTAVLEGAIVYINVTVVNLGELAETFNVASFYDDSTIGYLTVTNLAPQTSTSLIFAWDTTGVAPHTYYIRAMADSSRTIVEVNENNNNCTELETVTVFSSGDMGELFVDKTETAVITGEDPPVVGLPTVYELTITVANVGGSALSNVEVNETISEDVAFVSIDMPSQGSVSILPPSKITWTVGTLDPGAHATLAFRVNLTPTSPGPAYINHKEHIIASGVDILNHTVSDTGDTDVTTTAVIRDVAAISQVPSTPVVNQGETAAIFVSIKNLGNVSETFDVSCHLGTSLIGVMRVYNLAAGDQTTLTFACDTTSMAPGTYSVVAEADSNHEISESNEANNLCTAESTIEIVIHDITLISQNPSPTTVIQGATVAIEVLAKNEGTETETFDVSCYYNATFLATQTVTNLAPNTTVTLTFTWDTTDVPPGVYFVNSQAIPVTGERNTDNNACQSVTSVTVTASQYYLAVSSLYGITGGEGWYSTGSTAYATLDVGVVDHGNGTRRIFTSWSGDASGTDFAQSDPILMDAPRAAVANWKTQHYLTISSTSGGVTDPAGSGWYDAGTVVSVTAISDPDYVFSRWELDSAPVGATNPYDVVMNTSHTLHAVFQYSPPPPTEYYLTVQTDPINITSIPGEGWYIEGEEVTLTAPEQLSVSAGTRYHFDYWEIDGTPQDAEVHTITVTMNSNHTASAHYTLQYYLTVEAFPSGVTSIPGAGWYDASTSVPITGPAVPGYNFRYWEVEGTSQGSGVQSIFVVMNKPKTAIAYYSPITVGGFTESINLHLIPTWSSIVSMLTAAFCAVALYVKKRRQTV